MHDAHSMRSHEMKDDGFEPECVVTEIRIPLAAELRTHFLFFLVLSQSVSLSVALKLHARWLGMIYFA